VEAKRREEILRAACEAIALRGFAAVRISDIARSAGTSTGTIHYYFGSKRDVLHQALRYSFERSLERQMSELHRLRSARRKLIRLIDLNLPDADQVVHEWTVWMEFWIEALHRPDMRPANEELYGAWRRIVSEIIREGQRSGDFDRHLDASDAANRFVALVDGLAIQVLLHSRHMPASEMRRICIDYIDELAGRSVRPAI
jgi:AcrR family transcriptional regulator